jgi:hypothetical protein
MNQQHHNQAHPATRVAIKTNAKADTAAVDAVAAAPADIAVRTADLAISKVKEASPASRSKAARIVVSRAVKATSVASVAGGVAVVAVATAAKVKAAAAEAIAARVRKVSRAAEQSNAPVRTPHDCLITREMNAPPR